MCIAFINTFAARVNWSDKKYLDKSEWHKKQLYIKIGKRNCNINWPYTRIVALSVSAAEQ